MAATTDSLMETLQDGTKWLKLSLFYRYLAKIRCDSS